MLNVKLNWDINENGIRELPYNHTTPTKRLKADVRERKKLLPIIIHSIVVCVCVCAFEADKPYEAIYHSMRHNLMEHQAVVGLFGKADASTIT